MQCVIKFSCSSAGVWVSGLEEKLRPGNQSRFDAVPIADVRFIAVYYDPRLGVKYPGSSPARRRILCANGVSQSRGSDCFTSTCTEEERFAGKHNVTLY